MGLGLRSQVSWAPAHVGLGTTGPSKPKQSLDIDETCMDFSFFFSKAQPKVIHGYPMFGFVDHWDKEIPG